MNYKRRFASTIRTLAIAAATLSWLLAGTHANADGGDSLCLGLYGKSGATPGTPSCVRNVTSNTPVGMGSYNCPNNTTLIQSWCGTPSPVDPDKNCAAADPVLPVSGVTTLAETDFASGDDIPLTFTRSYRSSPFVRNDSGIGVGWFHNWQRQLSLAGINANPPSVSAIRSDGNRVSFAKIRQRMAIY